jgi:hypothetical protein
MIKGNNYKEERKKRSYSEDDTKIINIMKK